MFYGWLYNRNRSALLMLINVLLEMWLCQPTVHTPIGSTDRMHAQRRGDTLGTNCKDGVRAVGLGSDATKRNVRRFRQ